MTARTRTRIPLSPDEREAMHVLCFLVEQGLLPRNPALLARLRALLAA
jgi:hypothetical protein